LVVWRRHLYEVYIQPIYFGAPSQNLTVGLLAVGHEVNERAAKEFASIASSEVAFNIGDTLVASTLAAWSNPSSLASSASGRKAPPMTRKNFSWGLNAISPGLSIFRPKGAGCFPHGLEIFRQSYLVSQRVEPRPHFPGLA